MIITINRYHRSRWGIDGVLSIDGAHICETVEHPTKCLPSGEYPITLKRMILRHGNGPFLNTHGEICVGRYSMPGLVLQSRPVYQSLYERIKKSLQRGHEVKLIIE